MPIENHRFIFALPVDKYQRLRTVAKSEGKTVKQVLNQLIDDYLTADEDIKNLKANLSDLQKRFEKIENAVKLTDEEENDAEDE